MILYIIDSLQGYILIETTGNTIIIKLRGSAYFEDCIFHFACVWIAKTDIIERGLVTVKNCNI